MRDKVLFIILMGMLVSLVGFILVADHYLSSMLKLEEKRLEIRSTTPLPVSLPEEWLYISDDSLNPSIMRAFIKNDTIHIGFDLRSMDDE